MCPHFRKSNVVVAYHPLVARWNILAGGIEQLPPGQGA